MKSRAKVTGTASNLDCLGFVYQDCFARIKRADYAPGISDAPTLALYPGFFPGRSMVAMTSYYEKWES